LVEIVAGEGDTVAIGEVIARLGEAGEAPSGGGGEESAGAEQLGGEDGEQGEVGEGPESDQSPDDEAEPAEDAESAPVATEEDSEAPAVQGAPSDGNGRVKASPVARRMAAEMSVDLSSLEGSGPGGRIVKADVLAAADGADGAGAQAEEASAPETGSATSAEDKPEAPPSERPAAGDAGAKGETETIELTRLQKTVARRMAESKATAPDFQIHIDVDMSACVALRAQLKEVMERAPSFNDMIVKASALALREYPRVNGAYKDGSFELYSRVNVGVAVAAQDALVVPTIFDADKKSLGAISREARGLAGKVRDGQISPPELSGGTFTVSNLGMFGVDDFVAVINPPQAAILGVGAMNKKPVVDADGRIVARDIMGIRLSGDHRILYGADGAQFLGRIKDLLEQPLQFAL
jgi:pyruvate dehydrogenase E2 component (dihydrolipoamide acetyltransferase)